VNKYGQINIILVMVMAMVSFVLLYTIKLDYVAVNEQIGAPCKYINNSHVRSLCIDVWVLPNHQPTENLLAFVFGTDPDLEDRLRIRNERIKFTIGVIEHKMQKNNVYPCDRMLFSDMAIRYNLEVIDRSLIEYDRICLYDPYVGPYEIELVYSF